MKKYLYGIAPIAGIFGLLLFVFWPALTGGAYLNTGVIYSDLWILNYPLKDWFRTLLLEGKFPFWLDLLNNGYPIFAEGQIGSLYPFHLVLFSLLPTITAYNLNIFLHALMAAGFTYLFCRVSLKLSAVAAVLAGIVFSLSGFFIAHMHQTNVILVVSYFPLVMLAIERMVSTERLLWVFVLAITFVMQILAGYIEMHYYTVLIGVIYFVILTFFLPKKVGKQGKKSSSLKLSAFLVMALVLAVGVSAVQLLSTWELTNYSSRAEGLSFETAASFVWPLDKLVMFINPRAYDFFAPEAGYHPLQTTSVNIQYLYGYVGILPLIFSIAAIVFLRKRKVVVFSVLLLGAFVYGLGRSTQIFAILWELVPGLKYFRYPVKIIFFIDFCLAVLAGFGFDWLRGLLVERKIKKSAVSILSVVVLLVVFADLYINTVRVILPTVPAKEWLALPEAAGFLQKEIGERPFRIYSHGTNNIDYRLAQDAQMQKELQNILPVDFNLLFGLASNREASYGLFLMRHKALNTGKTALDTERGVMTFPQSFKKALALQSVRYLVTDMMIEDEDMELVREIPFSREIDHNAYFASAAGPRTVTVPAKATHIYEYGKAYPRALFVPQARVIEDEEEILEAILDEGFDPEREVILEEEVEWGGVGGKGEAEILKDEESLIEISVEAESDGFLVLADSYYPGWRAEVDGEEKEILLANYVFRAVRVSAGRHEVKFWFEPTYWRIGLWISGISLVILMGGLGYTIFVRSKE